MEKKGSVIKSQQDRKSKIKYPDTKKDQIKKKNHLAPIQPHIREKRSKIIMKIIKVIKKAPSIKAKIGRKEKIRHESNSHSLSFDFF